jgi:hypothetical protein
VEPLLTTLVGVLDGSDAARRPEPAEKLWIAPAGFGKRRAADNLLTRVLDTLHESRQPAQLLASVDEMSDIGSGTWRESAPGHWRMTDDFDTAEFLRSRLHAEGNYAVVVTSKSECDRFPADLPWWGPSRWKGRAARIRRGLRDASIVVALVVHHDASDWILAIADD